MKVVNVIMRSKRTIKENRMKEEEEEEKHILITPKEAACNATNKCQYQYTHTLYFTSLLCISRFFPIFFYHTHLNCWIYFLLLRLFHFNTFRYTGYELVCMQIRTQPMQYINSQTRPLIFSSHSYWSYSSQIFFKRQKIEATQKC